MGLFIINIILLLFSIILFITTKKKKNYNKKIEEEEWKLQEIIEDKKNEIHEIIQIQTQYKNSLNNIKERIKENNNFLEEQKNILTQSFSQYVELLDNNYLNQENEYDCALEAIKKAYGQEQERLMAETAVIQNDLDKIRTTRAATQEALLKEKEIKDQLDFYCLHLSQEEIDDINTLERVKSKLHQPRILCMLIWSTYFQKPMTTLCNNILGTEKITGIYKITNQKTNECYIGQSLDISTRWKNHAKCGLGIDTPQNNKLYKAMQEDGIWNFSWELLENCPKEQLDEKEKFYIELYQSKEYGYNSIAAPKKK